MVPWLAANLWLGACTWTSGGRPARCAGYPASLSTELLLTTGTELLLTTGTEWRPAPRPPACPACPVRSGRAPVSGPDLPLRGLPCLDRPPPHCSSRTLHHRQVPPAWPAPHHRTLPAPRPAPRP